MMPYKIAIINLWTKIKVISLSLLILPGLIGCYNSPYLGFNFSPSEIAQLKVSKDTDSQIYLQGKVVKIVKFLDSSAYLLEDTTGSIWVYTRQELPKIGNSILIQGQLQYQNIPIEDQELGEYYVIELKQIELDKPE